jgi:membrane-associated phospholipid phosphatase
MKKIENISDKVAFLIAGIFTPPLMASVAILMIARFYAKDINDMLVWSIIGIILLIGPASVYVFLNYSKGKLEDINLSRRKERLIPLYLALLGAIFGLAIMYYKRAPEPLIILNYTLIIDLLVITIITFYWKVSVHMLTLTSVITLLCFLFEPRYLILFILCLPVGWSRISRKRHSLSQVLVGSILGIMTVLIVLQIFSFN